MKSIHTIVENFQLNKIIQEWNKFGKISGIIKCKTYINYTIVWSAWNYRIIKINSLIWYFFKISDINIW